MTGCFYVVMTSWFLAISFIYPLFILLLGYLLRNVLLEYFNMSLMVITVLLCTILLGTVGGQCFDECYCSIQFKGSIKFSCDGRNISHFPLASQLPENIAIINFKGNRIKRLQNQSSGVTRTKVWYINLADNVINQLWQDNLGETFPNLSQLDLTNNKIVSLSKNSFLNLTKLKVLHLSSNKLRTINQGWFSHLLLLSHLYLHHNEITVIVESNEIWPKDLDILYLSYNQLKTIPPLPPKASEVNLIGNPIFCGCYIDVNLNIEKTSVKVDCHRLEHYREKVRKPAIGIKNKRRVFEKYKVSGQKCQAVVITNFSYFQSEEQLKITCVTSLGYPKAAVFIYFQDNVTKYKNDITVDVRKSRRNITVKVTQAGVYTCKVTNYISSDKKQLFIPSWSPMSTWPPVLNESETYLTRTYTENRSVGNDSRRLETTSQPESKELASMYMIK